MSVIKYSGPFLLVCLLLILVVTAFESLDMKGKSEALRKQNDALKQNNAMVVIQKLDLILKREGEIYKKMGDIQAQCADPLPVHIQQLPTPNE